MTKPLALIVEDDPKLNQIFTLSLAEIYETEAVSDGDAALEQLTHVTPRIILLDLNLPGVSGSRIVSHIRADARLKDMVILLCTADDRQADALRDQVDFILLKPISPMQLRSIASRLK
jgi:CheY-like chemotaxis protein